MDILYMDILYMDMLSSWIHIHIYNVEFWLRQNQSRAHALSCLDCQPMTAHGVEPTEAQGVDYLRSKHQGQGLDIPGRLPVGDLVKFMTA